MSYSPWGGRQSDMTQHTNTHIEIWSFYCLYMMVFLNNANGKELLLKERKKYVGLSLENHVVTMDDR